MSRDPALLDTNVLIDALYKGSEEEAARRAWATVNKIFGGGKKSGQRQAHQSARKGGRLGGAASARKAAATRASRAK